jgi:predicted RNA-binding Zn ribbon-like protein
MTSYAKAAGGSRVFELSGGHPALDLVNTLDDRFGANGERELLNDYADLLAFARQTGLMSAVQVRLLAGAVGTDAAGRALRAVKELRESLAAILYAGLESRAPRAADLQTLQRHFQAAAQHAQLRWHIAGGRHGHIVWTREQFASEAEYPLWLLAQSAAELLLSASVARVRACGAATCRWLFLDSSKNHTRRWCNMKVCGNRMKARRFQARHAG